MLHFDKQTKEFQSESCRMCLFVDFLSDVSFRGLMSVQTRDGGLGERTGNVQIDGCVTCCWWGMDYLSVSGR